MGECGYVKMRGTGECGNVEMRKGENVEMSK
jgi:hypothetical protein